ncbi:hypothetical protein SteCoe_22648 [Stentor coeruleus]|uniref:Uncharacterized protein n=1 Tax=Stentor coeruleus TaxID=5963 RepID=A0A1R2BLS6_9CILI|nr:hypothetical protein SteCoe_22648 [Stentor coeruleus]
MSNNKIPLKILETGICRGSKLLNWFYSDPMGIICKKPIKGSPRTKHLLNYFLNQRVLILEQYNPDKIICYLYHRKGIKIVNAKEAIELAGNQLHGLQVRSIHLALPSSANYHNIYRISALNNNGELHNTLTYGKLSKDSNEEIKDPVICERAHSLIVYLSDLILKHYLKHIKSLRIDLIADINGQFHIIKIEELTLSDSSAGQDSFKRRNGRTVTLKTQEDSSEELSEEPDTVYGQIKIVHEKDQRKRDANYKISLKKNTSENSDVFLEMIAKTFDRERKTQEALEIIKYKREEIESADKVNKRKAFQMNSLKSSKESLPKKCFNSINDLLYYVEKTRPRVWLKDSQSNEIQSNTIDFQLNSPTTEKDILQESSELEQEPKDQKLSGTNSQGYFKRRYEQTFMNFLSDEENRIKNKILTNRLKINSQSQDHMSFSGHKSGSSSYKHSIRKIKSPIYT